MHHSLNKLTLLFSLQFIFLFGQSNTPVRTGLSTFDKNEISNQILGLTKSELLRDFPETVNSIQQKRNHKTVTTSGANFLVSLVGDSSRRSFTYDVSGNRLSEFTETKISDNWVNNTLDSMTYDNHGNLMSRVLLSWTNNTWVYNTKYSYTYDNLNRLLLELSENWQSNSWYNSSKSTYTYSIDGKLLIYLREMWQNNLWVNSQKYSYVYDIYGNRISVSLYLWQSNKWDNTNRYTMTYDINHNQLTGLYETALGSGWVNTYLYVMEYDIKNNLLTQTLKFWQNNTWTNTQRISYTYDNYDNRIASLFEMGQGTSWVNYSKSNNTYDADSNAVSGNGFRWINNLWVPRISTLYFYYNGKRQFDWINSSSAVATYRRITNIEEELQNLGDYSLFQNFPNPFNNSTRINFMLSHSSPISLEVFNAQGEKVAYLLNEVLPSGNHSCDFNATNLPSGTYFYRLTTENGSQYKKMILLK